MTHDEMIAVIQAHKEGKPIEKRQVNLKEWSPSLNSFNFDAYEYRIKTELPKEDNHLVQNLLDYFKNTTKEERQKDWDEIKCLYPYENKDWSEVFREPIPTVEDKPEPHYRPFKSAEEVMEAIKEHGDWLQYVNYKTRKTRILETDDDDSCICVHAGHWAFDDAFKEFTFADGTPFGKLEED